MSEGGSNTFNEKASSSHNALYEFCCELGLAAVDRQEVERRLKSTEDVTPFVDNGYATLNPGIRSFETAWDNLKGKEPRIPGITFDEGKPLQHGLAIPVRTMMGGASAIVVRGKDGGYRFMKSSKTSKVVPLTHVPQISGRNKVGDTPILRVTEGILKADISDRYGEIPCIGIHGVGFIPRDFVNVLKGLGVAWLHIALDVEENVVTQRMKIDLYEAAKRIGIEPIIETWDSRYKGIDEALVAGAEIEQVSEDEIGQMRRDGGLDLVYVKSANGFVYTSDETSQFHRKDVILTYHAFTSKDLRERIENGGIRRVETASPFPGDQRRLTERALNLWVPPTEYILSDPQRVRWIQRTLINHFTYLVPSKEERRLLMKWAAWIIQKPEQKARWAVILFSEAQQTGKTSMIMAFRNAIGEHNFSVCTNNDITSQYNLSLAGKQVVLINEVYQKDRYEVVNKMKEIITDDVIRIEGKYLNSFQTRNIASFILTTNESDALKIGHRDKRFAAIQCAEERASNEHYANLFKVLNDPWCGQVLREMLRKVNLAGFNATLPPPKTETTLMFIEASQSNGESWARSVVDGESWPGTVADFFTVDQIKAVTNSEFGSVLPKALESATSHTIGRWLREAGAHQRQVNIKGKNGWIKKRIWVIRGWEETYKHAPMTRFTNSELVDAVITKDKDGEIGIKPIPLPSNQLM